VADVVVVVVVAVAVGGTKADGGGDLRILQQRQVDEDGPMKRPRSIFVHDEMIG